MSELPPPIGRRDPAFARTMLALTAAGFSTFAVLYCVQPLLPLFTETFHHTPAEAALSVSAATVVLGAALLFAGVVADRVERRRMMVVSLALSSLLTLAVAFAPNWPVLLFARALTGLALSGVPAVALTYIAEEMDAEAVGLGVGLHIAGNVFGGMSGRLATGLLAESLGWRWAVAAVAVLGLASAALTQATLPASRRFARRERSLGAALAGYAGTFRDKGLPWLYLEGFLLMGSFVTIYNYIGFRLLAAPYGLSQTLVGLIFALYLLGVISSPLAGELSGRLGARRVFWALVTIMLAGVALTTARAVGLVVGGVALASFGFFGAHTVAAGWVSRRGGAHRAQASSMYLFFYYLGGSVLGYGGGLAWGARAWSGVATLIGAALALGVVVALGLVFLRPLPVNRAPSA